ncbi:sensor histidine kinase [Candidatus Nitrosotenuis chungbukensis]|uniref:sensor histidine kinase n=1 Tax=Candidatus Nitrosotenuis chungbukensis TaxID=1353246 RepID=UPI0026718902|nr:sensor histidine kinase [Candidatus Nitrosotenuis chungbukensis]WKT57886.1 sensor histidine kinase [Candidatus Nitrosotenuis chungbukensis]
MRISYLLIASITVLFLTYAIHSYFTYDFTVNEAKKTTLLRNQAQANNIMQDLDKYIDQKIADFHDLTQIRQIQTRVAESNRNFDPDSDLTELDSQIDAAADGKTTPFLKDVLKNEISDELRDFATAYNNEYNYDVIKELFVTNQYGANIALASGKSDYVQADEEWWQATKNKQIYVGPMKFDSNYNDHVMTFAYPILDDSSDYIGTLSVSVKLRVLLQEFVNDADVVNAAKKTVVLLDENGNVLFENGNFFPTETPKEYFSSITSDNGSFEYTLASPTFVSYASSIGYKDFSGSGWTVVIEQESSVVDEFEELEKNFLTSTLIGITSAAILGVTLSYFVTSPLAKLSKLTMRLGKGDFEAKTPKSRIAEINSIIDSFNEMEVSLKKLFKTEKSLAEANARIKNERLTAIGELAASMAHDMKNPLGTIQSGMDIIKRNTTIDPQIGEVIQRMERAVSRMSHQVEDVLNFVRITPLSLRPVSLNTMINSAIKSVETPKAIQVVVQGDDITITCDEKKMEIVFINLILNSIQSIAGQGKITIRISKANGNAVIEIEDTGSGVPQSVISDIFKPLVTTKQKGTGLGLASCKNIIEQHGGSIKFQNNPTIFTVTIPIPAN